MIKLREAQVLALIKAASGPFIRRLEADLRELFPERFSELGTNGTRAAIESGIEKARGYGMTREKEIAQFVGLMFMLGLEFDRDPDFLWAQRILRNSGRNPQERLAALYLLA